MLLATLSRTSKNAIAKTMLKSSMAARSFSSSWSDKEKAIEQRYFNKEDEKALRKLLKKMKSQTDIADQAGKADHESHDHEGLKKAVGDLKLSDETVAALLKWKHEH